MAAMDWLGHKVTSTGAGGSSGSAAHPPRARRNGKHRYLPGRVGAGTPTRESGTGRAWSGPTGLSEAGGFAAPPAGGGRGARSQWAAEAACDHRNC